MNRSTGRWVSLRRGTFFIFAPRDRLPAVWAPSCLRRSPLFARTPASIVRQMQKQSRQPIIESCTATLRGFRLSLDRIVIPQKSANAPEGPLCLENIRSVRQPAPQVENLSVEESIISQMLREGLTAKEIAREWTCRTPHGGAPHQPAERALQGAQRGAHHSHPLPGRSRLSC